MQVTNNLILTQINVLTFIVTSSKITKFVCQTLKSLQKPQLHQLHLPTIIQITNNEYITTHNKCSSATTLELHSTTFLGVFRKANYKTTTGQNSTY